MYSGHESLDSPCFANLFQHLGLLFGFPIVFFD